MLEIEEQFFGRTIACPECDQHIFVKPDGTAVLKGKKPAPSPAAAGEPSSSPAAAPSPRPAAKAVPTAAPAAIPASDESGSKVPKKTRPTMMDKARKKAEKRVDEDGNFIEPEKQKPIYKSIFFWTFMILGVAALITGPLIGKQEVSEKKNTLYKYARDANKTVEDLYKELLAVTQTDEAAAKAEAEKAAGTLKAVSDELKAFREKRSGTRGDNPGYDEAERRYLAASWALGERLNVAQIMNVYLKSDRFKPGPKSGPDEKLKKYLYYEDDCEMVEMLFAPFGTGAGFKADEADDSLLKVEKRASSYWKDRINKIKADLSEAAFKYMPAYRIDNFNRIYAEMEKKAETLPQSMFSNEYVSKDNWIDAMTNREILKTGPAKEQNRPEFNKLIAEWDRLIGTGDTFRTPLDESKVKKQASANAQIAAALCSENASADIGDAAAADIEKARAALSKVCSKVEMPCASVVRLHLKPEGAEALKKFFKSRNKAAADPEGDYSMGWFQLRIKGIINLAEIEKAEKDGLKKPEPKIGFTNDKFGFKVIFSKNMKWAPDEFSLGADNFPYNLLWMGAAPPHDGFALAEFVDGDKTVCKILALDYDPEGFYGRKIIVEYGGARVFASEK
jgi:predicted HicB family RNase H-like nuclease